MLPSNHVEPLPDPMFCHKRQVQHVFPVICHKNELEVLYYDCEFSDDQERVTSTQAARFVVLDAKPWKCHEGAAHHVVGVVCCRRQTCLQYCSIQYKAVVLSKYF